jgi:16S rRNA G966 N2-methylase RsmD
MFLPNPPRPTRIDSSQNLLKPLRAPANFAFVLVDPPFYTKSLLASYKASNLPFAAV